MIIWARLDPRVETDMAHGKKSILVILAGNTGEIEG